MPEHDTLKMFTFCPTEEQYDFQYCKNSHKSGNSPKSALREPLSFGIKQGNIQTYTVQKHSQHQNDRVAGRLRGTFTHLSKGDLIYG